MTTEQMDWLDDHGYQPDGSKSNVTPGDRTVPVPKKKFSKKPKPKSIAKTTTLRGSSMGANEKHEAAYHGEALSPAQETMRRDIEDAHRSYVEATGPAAIRSVLETLYPGVSESMDIRAAVEEIVSSADVKLTFQQWVAVQRLIEAGIKWGLAWPR